MVYSIFLFFLDKESEYKRKKGKERGVRLKGLTGGNKKAN
ncbi:hypothetical protein C2W64_01299 [Brevibacillus laterosporus]|nr:hypothetical protein C2W64_01299 [Brevibacillus laterosporus]